MPKKLKGGPFCEKKIEKKCHNAEKTERGDTLVSPGIVRYAKKRKTFLVQFLGPTAAILRLLKIL